MGEAHSDEFCHCQGCAGKYALLRDEENPRLAIFERRLPCCGCGIGWSTHTLIVPCRLSSSQFWQLSLSLWH
ncbi:Ribosomal protein L18ae family [Zea mays]|uniref:Ribosomal protein L18ae family n=1 Tax=Zea mays TaxID=4577 RepID=A0A1D6FG86_MAIZE|nr:Ribosomal protein L18ae family [Zea mays]